MASKQAPHKTANSNVELVLCILFGWMGAHRFYTKKYKSAVLYLLTVGLCGIGWIVDIVVIAARIAKENSAYSTANQPVSNSNINSPKLAYMEEQHKIYAERRAQYISNMKAEFSETVANIPRVEIEFSDEKINRRKSYDMPDIHCTNITRSTNMEKLFPLVVVDVETTGFKPEGNDIIEVSAIKYSAGFKPVSCFTTLLKPRKPIPNDATAVNHITDDMVKDCKPFWSVANSFSQYISGCNIVGHNVMFDLRFLFSCGATLPEKVRYYDTLDLARKTLVARGAKKYDHEANTYVPVDDDYDVWDYKLGTLCEYYDIFRTDAHRSLSDCYATGMLFKRLISSKTA